MECGAIVDLLRVQSLVDPDTQTRLKELLTRIVATLSKMCR